MRRSLSILLSGVVSFALLAPLVPPQPARTRLPECCRRAGRHHCSMDGPAAPDSDAHLIATCPVYSQSAARRATGPAPFLKPSARVLAAAPAGRKIRPRTAALRPSTFSCDSRKRGPPPLDS